MTPHVQQPRAAPGGNEANGGAQPDQPDPPRTRRVLDKNLPDCSIVRPTLDRNGGAVAAIDGFIADRRFEGQSPKFFTTVRQLAREADAAERRVH